MNATRQFAGVQPSEKIAVNMLGCGRRSAVQIGELAEARIQFGKRVFWNVKKVKEYVDAISS